MFLNLYSFYLSHMNKHILYPGQHQKLSELGLPEFMDPTLSETKRKKARTVQADSWPCSLYSLYFESPPLPFWSGLLPPSLPSPLHAFWPAVTGSTDLPSPLPTKPMVASPSLCIPPKHLSKPCSPFFSSVPSLTTSLHHGIAENNITIQLRFTIDPKKHKKDYQKESHICNLHCGNKLPNDLHTQQSGCVRWFLPCLFRWWPFECRKIPFLFIISPKGTECCQTNRCYC